MDKKNKKLKIAFVVGEFPVVSETFIIDQVADLKERGLDVDIFSFRNVNKEKISDRYYQHKMSDCTYYLEMPKNKLIRIFTAIPKAVKILFKKPLILFKALNFRKYGADALSLKLLFLVEPFLGKKYDLFHCHFGPIAVRFLRIRKILGLRQKFVTTLYAYDVSKIFIDEPETYYDELKKESSLFFVMSQNVKDRIISHGFNPQKIIIHPVGINIETYPFFERHLEEGEKIKIASVGRFVEKKGFDDLLRALALVKEQAKKSFKCVIVGDGPLRDKVYKMTDELGLKEVIEFRGFMKIEDIVSKLFKEMHFFVQPSKTASDGDME